jgi:hypothetical protein
MDAADARELRTLLAGYFGDQSIPVGVPELVFVSAKHPAYHEKFLKAIDAGLEAAQRRDPTFLEIINSTLGPYDAADALQYLEDLRKEYLEKYAKAVLEND